jgi:DNA polymerase-3 subunit alpha (Gram-positive type)
MMEKYSGLSVLDLPMNDPEVMELFISTKSLGVKPSDIDSEVGTFGLPEFGTKFVRQMIVESKPKNFADLLQISGLSHGTDVWLSNAQELIHNGTCTISEVIGTRDSIMTYLMNKGLEPSTAFNIMEITRKGRAKEKFTPEMIEEMKSHGVPDWYIESCMKIKYMFPKAHAVAYDMSALRLGWFKVHMPQVFYSAFLSVAPGGFEAEIAVKGKEHIKTVLHEIEAKGKEATQKEQDMISTLQLCNEACARGYKFLRPDLKKSHSKNFIPEGEYGIRCPFSSMGGLGDAAAESIYKAASEGEIMSVEDLKAKTQITKAVIEILRKNGVLDELNETNQLTMF